MMTLMPAIPESTKTSLAQRLRDHARANWPQLAAIHSTIEETFDLVCDLHVTSTGP
jgi:hypothetical protein